ncbi:hypothetical protein Ancab_038573 [Ancistrocladus abbreviatus]
MTIINFDRDSQKSRVENLSLRSSHPILKADAACLVCKRFIILQSQESPINENEPFRLDNYMTMEIEADAFPLSASLTSRILVMADCAPCGRESGRERGEQCTFFLFFWQKNNITSCEKRNRPKFLFVLSSRTRKPLISPFHQYLCSLFLILSLFRIPPATTGVDLGAVPEFNWKNRALCRPFLVADLGVSGAPCLRGSVLKHVLNDELIKSFACNQSLLLRKIFEHWIINKMTEPSKVIHVRNVGHEISENDLLQLFQPFGVITKLVMLRAKNQALVQMQDIPSAIGVLQFYANVQPSIRGRNVYVQFSSHQELTTMDQNSQSRGDEPNRILLVTIHQMLYPITVDVLHQVFSPHGFVEKIVTFQKSAGFQALIQYQSRQNAVTARNLLQGRNVYDGCCQLDIQFSNLDELQVNYNNERTRDFTNPSLPAEPKGRSSQQQQPGYVDAGGMYALQAAGTPAVILCDNLLLDSMANHAAIAAAFGGVLPPGVSGMNDRYTVLASNLNPDRIDEDKLFNLFSLYGNIVRIKLLRSKPDHALVQMGDGFQAELAVHFLKGAVLFGKRLDVNFSKYPNITSGADTHEYGNSNLNRFNRNAAKNYRYCCSPTKLIHLSTLPQDITEEEIVRHLEEHGPIVSTKLFETNGKKQALVMFETEEQATEALVCKHASSLGGSVIRISFSQSQAI